MSEPVEDSGEVDEPEIGFGEFVVAGRDPTVDFDATGKIFDLMTAAVVTAMETSRLAAISFGRDAAASALTVKTGAEDIGVETFVGDKSAAPRAAEQG